MSIYVHSISYMELVENYDSMVQKTKTENKKKENKRRIKAKVVRIDECGFRVDRWSPNECGRPVGIPSIHQKDVSDA